MPRLGGGSSPSRASMSMSASSMTILVGALTTCHCSAWVAARERVRIAPSVSSRLPFTCIHSQPI
jgi:hypothetical protein